MLTRPDAQKQPPLALLGCENDPLHQLRASPIRAPSRQAAKICARKILGISKLNFLHAATRSSAENPQQNSGGAILAAWRLGALTEKSYPGFPGSSRSDR